MGELFDDDDEDLEQPSEGEEDLEHDEYQASPSRARRRLESMLAKKIAR